MTTAPVSTGCCEKGMEQDIQCPLTCECSTPISNDPSATWIQSLNSYFSKRKKAEEEIKEGDNGEERGTVNKPTCHTACQGVA